MRYIKTTFAFLLLSLMSLPIIGQLTLNSLITFEDGGNRLLVAGPAVNPAVTDIDNHGLGVATVSAGSQISITTFAAISSNANDDVLIVQNSGGNLTSVSYLSDNNANNFSVTSFEFYMNMGLANTVMVQGYDDGVAVSGTIMRSLAGAGANNYFQLTSSDFSTAGGWTNIDEIRFTLATPTPANWALDDVLLGAATTPNSPPVASNVSVSGSSTVGQILMGTYTYSDNESNPESGSIYRWLRADDAFGTNKVVISGATTTNYTSVSADIGKFISFEVTPNDGTAAGTPVESSSVEITCTNPNVSISGIVDICQDESLTLNETAGDAVSWNWTTNGAANILTSSASATVIENLTNGEVITVTIQDGFGCSSQASTTIIVNSLPNPVITASLTQACACESVTLTATGGDTYTWSTGQSGNQITVDPNTVLTYSITATTLQGCKGAASVTITLISDPVVSVTLTNSTVFEDADNITFIFTFTRNRCLDCDLTVNFLVSGTAIFNDDYYLVRGADTFTDMGGTAIIPAGQTSVQVVLQTQQDAVEESDETIILTVDNP